MTLNDGMTNLVGNMVVCSGAIAYQGPFTAAYRARLNEAWVSQVKGLGIKSGDNPTVAKVLADPVAVRHWGICGLPLDSLSVENAIFVTRSRRWSLMMDPQGQANRWIKNLQKENRLRVTKMTQSDFLRVLEQSSHLVFRQLRRIICGGSSLTTVRGRRPAAAVRLGDGPAAAVAEVDHLPAGPERGQREREDVVVDEAHVQGEHTHEQDHVAAREDHLADVAEAAARELRLADAHEGAEAH